MRDKKMFEAMSCEELRVEKDRLKKRLSELSAQTKKSPCLKEGVMPEPLKLDVMGEERQVETEYRMLLDVMLKKGCK